MVAVAACTLFVLTRCAPPPEEPLTPPAPPVAPAVEADAANARTSGGDAGAVEAGVRDAGGVQSDAATRAAPCANGDGGDGGKGAGHVSWSNEKGAKWQLALHGYVSRAPLAQQRPIGAAASAFATWLARVHNRIHPLWADGYIGWLATLPCDDPRNDIHLVTKLEVTVAGSDGHIVSLGVLQSSGIEDFDLAAITTFVRAAPFDVAPAPTQSWDGNVYFQWELHRDEVFACSTINVRPFMVSAPTP